METADSLIIRQKTQMELIPSTAMPDAVFAADEQACVGEFTGDRFFKQRPDDYRMVVSLLAEGVGINRIAKLVKVSPGTVTAVRDRERIPIGMVKEDLSRLAHTGAKLAMEGIIFDLTTPTRRDNIPAGTKAMIAGILTDKGQLLAGEATARLEVTEITEPDHDAYNAYLRSLKSAATGLVGGKAAQKEGVAAPTAGAARTTATAPDGGIIEIESTATDTKHST